MSIWQSENPLLILAPMHEVTDVAFRETVASCGAPDLMMTEFVSVDGLSHPAARERIIHRYLQRGDTEDRTIAQFWGSDPEKFYGAAVLSRELGFAGVDINMGCPDKTVVKHGGGGALIQDPARARSIIAATREGAGAIPVSVKTRLGFDRDIADTWIPSLVDTGIAGLTLHARTVKEMSRVPARWERVADLAPLVRAAGVTFIGNGDITSREDAYTRVRHTGCDGAMIGRAVFGNFWFFHPERETVTVPLAERLMMLSDFAERFEYRYGDFRSISVLRKHVKGLVHGFSGASELRERLMQCATAKAFRMVAEEYRA